MILIAAGPVAFTCYKLGKWAQNSPTGFKTVKLLSKFLGALATAIGAIHLAHEYAHASDTTNSAATAYAIGSFILGFSSCNLGYSLANDYVEGVSEFCASLQQETQQL
jgi:hypothetical protein